MTLREELNAAQMYTHTWGFLVVINLIAMAVQASLFPGRPVVPIVVLSIFAVMTAVSMGLSMAMHADHNVDAKNDNQLLADAEKVTVSGTIGLATLAFIVFWFLQHPARPFRVSPIFGYVLFGLVGSGVAMMLLYIRGNDFRDLHKAIVNERGGTSGWSGTLEKWAFYHVQWHLIAGFYAFLLSIGVYIVLKTKYDTSISQ